MTAFVVSKHCCVKTISRVQGSTRAMDRVIKPFWQPNLSEEHSHEENENTEFRRHFDEDKMRPSEAIHGEADKMRLSMFSQELMLNRKPGVLDQALQRITHQLKLRRARV